MPNIYVRSTDGNDLDDGSTWALAKAKLAGATGIDAAGDVIYVSQSHAESNAATQNFNFAGTNSNPVKVFCGSDTAEPPISSQITASITTTGNTGITISGSVFIYGIAFNVGTGASGASASLSLNNAVNAFQRYANCSFRLNTSASSQVLNTTSITSSLGQCKTDFENCSVRFGNASQVMQINRSMFEWNGGSILSGGTSPTNLLSLTGTNAYPCFASLSGIDLSAAASTINLITGAAPGLVKIRNCKLPSGWTGALFSGSMSPGFRAEMHNCDAGDTNYRLWVEDFCGTIKNETTIVNPAGAYDGTTSLSWKMATSSGSSYPTAPLKSVEIVRWNETVGSAITATVEVVTDGVTLTDEDCWLEIQYLGTTGFPISTFAKDSKSDLLAAASNQTSSTAAWVTTGLGAPVKQKLEVTFTPQEKGFIHAVIFLTKPSTTIYVDPLLTV